MKFVTHGCALLALFCFGCSASRKISQLTLREPSSVQKAVEFSDLRLKLSQATLSEKCPESLRANLPSLALVKIDFPVCPDGMAATVENAMMLLKIDERSLLEEVLTSKCRSMGSVGYGESLESILENYETTGPFGRRAKEKRSEQEIQLLLTLKSYLKELVEHHSPLDRWIGHNGEFILPEEDVAFLFQLTREKNCRLGDNDLDKSYRSIRSLEDLSKVLKDESQLARMNAIAGGIQQLIDKRLLEFFYP